MSINPFLANQRFPQWNQLQPEHAVPAILSAIESAQQTIADIIALPTTKKTYQHSFAALETGLKPLSQVLQLIGHLNHVADSAKLRTAYQEVYAHYIKFDSAMTTNNALWQVLKDVAATPDNSLSAAQRRDMDNTCRNFILSGANLAKEQQQELTDINLELAKTTQQFSQNVLDSTNAWQLIITDKQKLTGIPENNIEIARISALENGYGSDTEPQYRFTLQAPSYFPVMQYATNDSLRKSIWDGLQTVGHDEPYNNAEIMRKIIQLRQQKATLLGYQNFAEVILQGRMADTPTKVADFITELHQKTMSFYRQEMADIAAYKSNKTESEQNLLSPWELEYWKEQRRADEYAFNEEELRPYFAIEQVVTGMYSIAEKLFNISIIALPTTTDTSSVDKSAVEVWDQHVKAYQIIDKDNQIILGSFYTDWFPRTNKVSGAWMQALSTGDRTANSQSEAYQHIGVMCGNMSMPVGDKPALLSFAEVETVFHEFGHLLHHILSQTTIPNLSGVNVALDFVELPSQLMENFCSEQQCLNLFAKHYQTKETIPEQLITKMQTAKNLYAAGDCVRQLSLAWLDFYSHTQTEKLLSANSIEEFDRKTLADFRVPLTQNSTSILRKFTHLFANTTGYSCGYYSYKWSEVLDADAYTKFKEDGVLSPAVGQQFKQWILEQGDSADPAYLYQKFRGREPHIDALINRMQLAK